MHAGGAAAVLPADPEQVGVLLPPKPPRPPPPPPLPAMPIGLPPPPQPTSEPSERVSVTSAAYFMAGTLAPTAIIKLARFTNWEGYPQNVYGVSLFVLSPWSSARATRRPA